MILNNFFMSFLYNIEIDFLVKPWLCWTTKFFCKSFWIISSSCHFFRISCQTLIMLDMPRFWIARLNLKWNCGCNDQNFRLDHFSDLHEDTDGDDCSTKRTMFSHLSRFGSKSFAEEQLVLIEQHLYKLCDKACGSPMCICICHIQTPRNRCGKKNSRLWPFSPDAVVVDCGKVPPSGFCSQSQPGWYLTLSDFCQVFYPGFSMW